jgi:hypothetical protein
MSKIKKMYRDFFGLTEQSTSSVSVSPEKLNEPNVQSAISKRG